MFGTYQRLFLVFECFQHAMYFGMRILGGKTLKRVKKKAEPLQKEQKKNVLPRSVSNKGTRMDKKSINNRETTSEDTFRFGETNSDCC